MTTAEQRAQLEWEARAGRPAAAAAVGFVALQVATFVLQAPAVSDAPDDDDPDRHGQSLINFQEHSDSILAASIAQALAFALAAGALYYLFRATRFRRAQLFGGLRWLLLLAPIFALIGGVLNYANLKDVSDQYTDSGTLTSLRAASATGADREEATTECRKRRGTTREDREGFERRFESFDRCVAQRAEVAKVERKDQQAEALIDEDRNILGQAISQAGVFAIALLYLLVSLNAMRAGLLSRFMGILGVIAGVLQILPLAPVPVVQLFWVGALAPLFLGRGPNGRGPAWETGRADPWPSPTVEARSQSVEDSVESQFESQRREADANEPEREQHPASKKRKRKRRR